MAAGESVGGMAAVPETPNRSPKLPPVAPKAGTLVAVMAQEGEDHPRRAVAKWERRRRPEQLGAEGTVVGALAP